MRPVVIVAVAALFALLPTLSTAQSDIDRAFEMQNAPSRSRLSVDGEVKDAQRKVDSNVAERHTANERARAEERSRLAANGRASESSDSPIANVTSGAWKVIKKYEGGFADFGFDWHSTVYVVRCGSGAEKKIYSDKKGLWGTVGLGGNNGSSTFEDAANKNCK